MYSLCKEQIKETEMDSRIITFTLSLGHHLDSSNFQGYNR